MLHRLYTRIDQRTDERIATKLGQPMVSGLTDEHLRLLLDALSRQQRIDARGPTAPGGALRAGRAARRAAPDLEDLRRCVADLDRRTRAERTELMYECATAVGTEACRPTPDSRRSSLASSTRTSSTLGR